MAKTKVSIPTELFGTLESAKDAFDKRVAAGTIGKRDRIYKATFEAGEDTSYLIAGSPVAGLYGYATKLGVKCESVDKRSGRAPGEKAEPATVRRLRALMANVTGDSEDAKKVRADIEKAIAEELAKVANRKPRKPRETAAATTSNAPAPAPEMAGASA